MFHPAVFHWRGVRLSALLCVCIIEIFGLYSCYATKGSLYFIYGTPAKTARMGPKLTWLLL